MTLTKVKMLTILANLAKIKKLEIDYTGNDYSEIEYFQILSACDEIGTDIDVLTGTFAGIKIEIVQNTLRNAEDNDIISLIFKFKEPEGSEGYLEFKGRYSSWDSSSYYTVNQVYPRKIEKTIYVTKLDEEY